MSTEWVSEWEWYDNLETRKPPFFQKKNVYIIIGSTCEAPKLRCAKSDQILDSEEYAAIFIHESLHNTRDKVTTITKCSPLKLVSSGIDSVVCLFCNKDITNNRVTIAHMK